jgi:hypothetical protein
MDKLWTGFTIIVLLEIEETYFFAGLLQALRPARQQTPTNSFSRNLKYNRIRGKDEPFQLEQQLDMPFLRDPSIGMVLCAVFFPKICVSMS